MNSQRRGVLLAASLSMVTMGSTSIMTGALLPSIVRDLGLSAAQAGLLVSSPGLGYIVSVALVGLLGDALGYQRVWLVGVAMGLIAALGIALAPSFLYLLPAVGAFGLVVGSFDGSINPLVAGAAEGRSGAALNRVHSFFGVGATTGPLLVGLGLRQGVPWRWHYALITLYLVVVAVAILRIKVPGQTHGPAQKAQPFGAMLLSRPVLLAALAMLIYGGVEACIFSWTSLYLVRVRAAALSTASLAVSAFSGALLVGRFACGQVVEQIGYKRLVVGGALVGALGVALLILLPGTLLPWFGLALAGLAWAGIFATVVADVTRKVSGHAGALAGLVCAASGVGKIMLPWLVGQAAQATGLSTGLWLVVGFSVLMGLAYLVA